MKAQTAAIKYGWLLALSIATGDDPEADARTDEGGEQRRDEHPADAPNVRCPEDVLAELPASVTIDEAASVLVKHWPGLCAEDRIAAWREIIRRCPPKTSAAALKKACEAEHAWHAKRAAEAKAGSNEPPRNSSDAAPVTTPKAPPAAPTPANDAPAATAHDVATARLRVVLSTCIDVPGVCDVVVRSAREFHPLEEIEITKLGAERIQAITNCTPMQAVNRIRDAANQARGRKLRAVR